MKNMRGNKEMAGDVLAFTLQEALLKDEKDGLKGYKSKFHNPIQENGTPYIYLCGNSLGLQPKTTESHVSEVLNDWKRMGVEGHFHAKNPWVPFHSLLTESMANVVGAKPEEVVVMNTLTVNLHLMLVSFYQPKGRRNKILIEADAFPSDLFAVTSQIKLHGLDPEECLIELKPREGENCLREEDILEVIQKDGKDIALILLGNTNYYTGQFFNMKTLSSFAHSQGCKIGFDCAHGAGNLPLNLHDSGCDFAVWCTYKYLNSGPGSIGGVFVHERHTTRNDLPRLEGWWGHDENTRFEMRGKFKPMKGVEAWQLSCPPILSMVPIWASLKMFDEVGITNLRIKSKALTQYLESLVLSLDENRIRIITPSDPEQRGSQLSIQVKNADKRLFDQIMEAGVIVDWREPDVIRVAPTPLYNSFEDVFRFYIILKSAMSN